MKPVIITVKHRVLATNVPDDLIIECAKDLTFDNPKFTEAQKHGRYVGINVVPKFKFYKAKRREKKIKFPKGYLFFFKMKLIKRKILFEIIDKTLKLPEIEINFIGKLRKYQKEASRDCYSYPCAVLEASTGSGKTITAIHILTKRKQPTLIIVHSKELLYQWEEALTKFTDAKVGLLGDGNKKILPITVGIINSVNKRVKELKSQFGHIIIDETHRAPASIFVETLKQFPAKFTLGLSATPYRRDGLGKAIYAFIGPKMHRVDPKRLRKEGAVLKPEIHRVNTNFWFKYRGNYTTMVAALSKDKDRNKIIAQSVHRDWEKYNDNILIVSDRVAHCKMIQEELRLLELPSELLTGKTAAKERQKIIENMKNGSSHILISTISLIGEGFDCPNLTSLFLTTPIKFKGRLIQIIGRILRPVDNKKPRLYDFRDPAINMLKYSGINRDRIYKKEWE